MNELEEAAAHWRDVDEVPESDLVAMLRPYEEARQVKADADTVMKVISDRLKAWLDRHPGDELVDGERKLHAFIKTRSGTESYDVSSMSPELVLRLHQIHALQVDVKVIRALAGKDFLPEEVKPYRVPGNETKVLHVEDFH